MIAGGSQGANWCRQENQDSGKPWSITMSGASSLPCSAMFSSIPLLAIRRLVICGKSLEIVTIDMP